jgi:hypothetical protein
MESGRSDSSAGIEYFAGIFCAPKVAENAPLADYLFLLAASSYFDICDK